MTGEKKYWVGFNRIRGIGPVRLQRLINYFGSIEAAWNASPEKLDASGLGKILSQRLYVARNEIDLDRVWEEIEAQGFQVLTWDDANYPLLLRSISQPPPLLYMDGELTDPDSTPIAIVGTRRPTSYGRRTARDLAFTLSRAGITTVSGLARGIDSTVHAETIRAGGRTIAVLGSGVDHIYPPENKRLSQNIRAQGAILSDFELGTPPDAVNFPARNRIISGLSKAVIVVEAGIQSGALITASFAADQGREVFAVPGPIDSPQSKGTNLLIEQGARPLLDPAEVLDFLNVDRLYRQSEVRQVVPDDPDEKKILELIRQEPLYIDDICTQTGMSVEKVTAILTMMELKGLVRRESGPRYGALREVSPEYRLEPSYA